MQYLKNIVVYCKGLSLLVSELLEDDKVETFKQGDEVV